MKTVQFYFTSSKDHFTLNTGMSKKDFRNWFYNISINDIENKFKTTIDGEGVETATEIHAGFNSPNYERPEKRKKIWEAMLKKYGFENRLYQVKNATAEWHRLHG